MLSFLAVFLCALVLTGCSDNASQDNVKAESLLNRGNGAEPESLDMHKAASFEAHSVQRDLGEGLTGFTIDGRLRAAAAKRWDVSPDGLVYTFWLREDARWSNGDPLTAEDFVYSYRRLVNPDTAAVYVGSIDSIENATAILSGDLPPDKLGVTAIDTYQLQIRLKQPVLYFLSLLTHPSTFPVHRDSIERRDETGAPNDTLVSNGAYRLIEWRVGSFIELHRNENYWDNANTTIDRVRFHVTPQPMVELNRFRAGELHVTSSIPAGAFAQMRKERPEEVRTSPSLGVHYYGFNLSNPLFAGNLKLRQALSMAIDRESIVENVVGRGEAPAYGWVPYATAGYETRLFSYAKMSQAERNAIARQLYKEAGYGPNNPLTIELRYNTSDAQQRIALAVQGMWSDVLGVKSELANEQLRVLIASIKQKTDIDIFRLSWASDYNDAHSLLKVLESGKPSNFTGYSSADFDSMMRHAGEQTDLTRREMFLGEAESAMLADHPLIPLYFSVNKNMVSKRVKGWGDNVLNYHYSQHLSLSKP